MDKQKIQLMRWIILNKKAILIYKDSLSSQCFPMKPLYAIPLNEVANIVVSEKQISAGKI
jgi:hypothetical protein